VIFAGPPAVDGSRTLRGAIFDVGGVLVGSPRCSGWRDALREVTDTGWAGLRGQASCCPERFTEAVDQQVIAGRPGLGGALAALEYFGVPGAGRRAPLCAADGQEHLVALIEEGEFVAFAGAVRFVVAVTAAGVAIAAASWSGNAGLLLRQVWLGTCVAGTGLTLLDLADADVCGRDLPCGKPDPVIFPGGGRGAARRARPVLGGRGCGRRRAGGHGRRDGGPGRGPGGPDDGGLMDNHRDDAADVLVIFGITGDLARRVTFRGLCRLERRGLLDCPVIGVASDDITAEQLVTHARQAIAGSGQDVDDAVFGRLARRMSYLSADVSDAVLYRSLGAGIGDRQRPACYLEVPRPCSPPSSGSSARRSCCATAGSRSRSRPATTWRRPASRTPGCCARARSCASITSSAREPVVELGYLRFANVALAGLRDRKSVSCAQITTAEDFGVEGRGRFYDSAGAPRDGVQNHLRRCWPWSPWTRRPAPAPATRRIRRRRCSAPCRRPFPGTACAASTRGTPTSPARRPGRPPRPSWRCGWRSATDAGPTSPVFLRAGKALPRKVTEVRLFLRRTPRLAFLPGPARAGPNQIVLRIDPDPGLRLQLSALAGQSWRPVHLDTSFARELGGPPEPYEVLLHAAMAGDHQYFARQDSVEETWRIVQPLLGRPPGVRPYPRGSWGPEEAETRVRGYPRWQQPWLPADR